MWVGGTAGRRQFAIGRIVQSVGGDGRRVKRVETVGGQIELARIVSREKNFVFFREQKMVRERLA